MSKKSYARVQDGHVVELFSTEREMGELFHPDILWTDLADTADVAVGWRYDGSEFQPPSSDAESILPSVADLEAQIRFLNSQLAARTGS